MARPKQAVLMRMHLREENISRLADLLAPMSQGKVIETDTALWQSYWWFVPVVLLLTAEWIIRKRTGCSEPIPG